MTPINPRYITIALILIFLVMTIGMIYSVSVETHTAIKSGVQEKLVAVAGTTASQIDGDTFARIRPGDENTDAFLKIREQLRSVKAATPDIHYIYTMRKEGDVIVYVVDADYGIDGEFTPRIGEPYPEAEAEMHAGFTAPIADREFTTDEWGTVLSGFAPVRDSTGTVVGIVGVDMDSSLVREKLDYLNVIFYGIGFLALITVVSGIIIFERRRAAAEKRVAESEEKYRLLFEQAADAIMIFEAEGERQGQITAANTVAASMHGYTIEEMLTKNIADLNSPESRAGVTERMNRVRESGVIRSDATHIRKDGTQFPVEITGALFVIGTTKDVLAIDRDISERKAAENALHQVTQKLNLLNAVTFNDIQNAVFTLSGYITLGKNQSTSETLTLNLTKGEDSLKKILRSLAFAKSYQNLGAHPAQWQDVNHAFILAISHLDFSRIERKVQLDSLEIFADPLLEHVFYTLADNVLRHATGATLVTLGYRVDNEDLVISFTDNGAGVPADERVKIFERGYGMKKSMELFLAREILGITGIAIRECGIPGSGAVFEIVVPRGVFRFPQQKTEMIVPAPGTIG